VSTDSVVATATIRDNGDSGAATVLWGDGTSSSRCPAGQEGPVHSGCMPTPFGGGSAAGTLVFKHRYTAPANGAPFTVVITGKLGAESQTIAIGVTPRYKVTVTDIEFSPLSHDCDTAAEEYTEWKVSREVYNDATTIVPRGDVPRGDWRFDRLTNPRAVVGDWTLPQFEPLPASGFSVELKASDHPDLALSITEIDPVEDDPLKTPRVSIGPLDGSRSIELQSQEFAYEQCRAASRFHISVRLLEPGLDRGPVVGQ
jgi:hypothetical protein